jgi:DNA-binding GntR family transcriptional regulator
MLTVSPEAVAKSSVLTRAPDSEIFLRCPKLRAPEGATIHAGSLVGKRSAPRRTEPLGRSGQPQPLPLCSCLQTLRPSSPHRYVLRRRIERAKYHLAAGELSLAAAALTGKPSKILAAMILHDICSAMTFQKTRALMKAQGRHRPVKSRVAKGDLLGEHSGDRLVDQAYLRLKADIITHVLEPGQKISEGKLVEHTGLSRAPVRSAMARLLQEGLVVLASSKTQIVAPLTMADVREIFHLRDLLEPDAARLAAGRVDIAMLKELNKACARPYTPGNTDEEFAFLAANRAFHLAIARSSGHPVQTQWIERLQDAVMRVLWLSLRLENRPSMWSTGHDDIIAALAAADGAAAERFARKHLLNGQKAVLDVLMRSRRIQRANLALLPAQ